MSGTEQDTRVWGGGDETMFNVLRQPGAYLSFLGNAGADTWSPVREVLSQWELKLVTRAWAIQWVEQREMDQLNRVYAKLFLFICY